LLRERLTAEGFLLPDQDKADMELFDPALKQALLNYQAEHGLEPDGVPGKRTIACLNTPVEARKDKDFLRSQGFRVSSGWGDKRESIDPYSVDWKQITPSTLRYRFTQDPGPLNSLGRVLSVLTGEERATYTVIIPDPIPIHILYCTVWVDDSGLVHFRPDIYQRDILLDRALNEPARAS